VEPCAVEVDGQLRRYVKAALEACGASERDVVEALRVDGARERTELFTVEGLLRMILLRAAG
jgi:hypothetical protein